MVAVGAGLLAGIAMWPYYMQPVDPSPAYLVPIKSIAGIGTFLAAHPWRIPLMLPFVLWIVSIIRRGPRV